jgi:hypothetical protein
MKTQNREFKWTAILWSGILILIIPLLVNILITSGYSIVIGFQTRGDMETINERVLTLAGSAAYLVFFVVLIGVIAFWRGRVISKKVSGQAVLHIVIATILGMLLRTILAIALATVDIGIILPWLIAEWFVALGGGYLGARLGSKNPGP